MVSRGGQEKYKNKKIQRKIKKNYRIWPSHFTAMPALPCGADFYNFWHVVSYGWHNHPCQILSRLVKGLEGYGSPKLGVSHWLWMSLLQQCYALTCYTVITTYDIWAQARHTLPETTLSGKIICAPARHSRTKYEVSSSSSFGDMFDRMPKIVGVTWPRPRPLPRKIICVPARHSRYKAAYQIWSI